MAVKPMEYNRISGNLLAGRNPLLASEVQHLAAEGVTHLLDLREEWEWQPPRLGMEAMEAIERMGLTRAHVAIVDGSAPTMAALDKTTRFLMETLASPDYQLYVHCRAGLERTAAVLIAYYVRRFGCTYDEAITKLRKGRPTLHPLEHQAEAVRKWIRFDLEAAYRATTYRVETTSGAITIRIGVENRLLDYLLAEHNAQTWAYVTAHNPGSCPLTTEENAQRHRLLMRHVDDQEYIHLPGQGMGDRGDWLAEESLLILDVTEAQAIALGSEFGQNAVVFGRRSGAPELLWCRPGDTE